jgi:hypothetical protein
LSRKDPQESLKSKMTLLHQMSNKNESLFASRSQPTQKYLPQSFLQPSPEPTRLRFPAPAKVQSRKSYQGNIQAMKKEN